MPYTTRNLLTETYQDIQVLAVGETLSAAQAENGLLKLVRLFGNWNAEKLGVYANTLTDPPFTLVPDLNPHTIGPSAATFTTTQRPVTIEYANIVLENDVRVPLNLRDAQWNASLSIPSIATSMPTDLYYNPTWPNGELWLYPVPDTAYGLVLLSRIVLADLGLDDTVTMPPGYRDAIILTLGEMIAATYPPAVANPEGASKSRARIFGNNDPTPALFTKDSGMPDTQGNPGTYFSWRSGLMRP